MSDDPFNPTLRRPCPLPRGTIRRGGGFCGTCGEVVHDLSTLSRAQARALPGRGDVRCVRFERGADGRMLHNLAVAAVVTALAGCAPHHGSPTVYWAVPPLPHAQRPASPGLIEVKVYDEYGLELLLAEVSLDGAPPVRVSDQGVVVFTVPDDETHRITVRALGAAGEFKATSGTFTEVILTITTASDYVGFL